MQPVQNQPINAKQLQLVAGAKAFGDGSHPTTQLILQLCNEYQQHINPMRIADIGCGSGIIAMRCVQLFPQAQIIASDTEPDAVISTQANAEANDIAEKIIALRAEGYDHPEIIAHAPYDLICCNILADILIPMARDAANALADGGVLMLSGILPWQQEAVMQAYVAAGLTPLEAAEHEGWCAIVLGR